MGSWMWICWPPRRIIDEEPALSHYTLFLPQVSTQIIVRTRVLSIQLEIGAISNMETEMRICGAHQRRHVTRCMFDVRFELEERARHSLAPVRASVAQRCQPVVVIGAQVGFQAHQLTDTRLVPVERFLFKKRFASSDHTQTGDTSNGHATSPRAAPKKKRGHCRAGWRNASAEHGHGLRYQNV